ncbi:MAG TPA: hypothetical protein VK667_03720 [Ktedonobacteraceae bacterium]|nr:hypothetical protein [Ktedonobacteraceae bacterium]
MATSAKNKPFTRQFAAPGIDSDISDYGIYSSGAGFHPEETTTKTSPYDWTNENPTFGHKTAELVNGYSATRAQTIDQARVRIRGICPWGGKLPNRKEYAYHPGGSVDVNAGAGSMIAGGRGSASSMVRVQKASPTRGMKLPVLPDEMRRGGPSPMPIGGSADTSPAPPFAPKVSGMPSIFGFLKKGT